jgi:hypothetical protein
MVRFLSVIVIMSGGTALIQGIGAQVRMAPETSVLTSGKPRAGETGLPSVPAGKSTVFGGEIRALDPVRDQMTLTVFGGRPMKILFDERTEVYRDGKKISLHELHPAEYASVQTTLDGTKLFAVSIHMLSRSQEVQYEGRVLNFSQTTGELTVAPGQAREMIKMLVQSDTDFARTGQTPFSSQPTGPFDLVPGTLVSVQFKAGGKAEAVASRVEVLAVPGSRFVFAGSLTSLDLHAGLFTLVDPRDNRNYQVSFDQTNIPATQNLHLGDNVRVEAEYDGTHYMASRITAN